MQILEKLIFPSVLCSALGSGLVAGLLFIFSNVIMRVLDQLPPEQGIKTMQSINIVIINPLFLMVFVGTVLFSVVNIAFALTHWQHPASLYIALGGAFYVLGTIGITALGNIPLNNALAILNPSEQASVQVWNNYIQTWTLWNHLRTATSILSLISLLLAVKEL